MENLVRSAMAPDTMVAAVAQNTVWKIRKPSMGNPLSMILSIASKLKNGGAHKTAYAEHQPEADEPEQDGAEHEVYQIFHQHVGRVLGTDEPGFYQGESRLHEEYQHGSK